MTIALALASTVTAFAQTKIETPKNLWWQTTCEVNGVTKSGIYAMWDEPTGADKYNVKLFSWIDPDGVGNIHKSYGITKNYYNLQTYFKNTGDYWFEVDVYSSGASSELYSDNYTPYFSAPLHAEIASDTGTVGSWRYDEGNNIWYYDYVNGELATGWNLINDKIYYFGEEESNKGVMFTGTHTIYDLNFQFAESGELMQRIK